MSSVVAAVSKQYNSNDFITGYADSGIAYTHVGATQILSSLRLRVIDPQTKELAGKAFSHALEQNCNTLLETLSLMQHPLDMLAVAKAEAEFKSDILNDLPMLRKFVSESKAAPCMKSLQDKSKVFPILLHKPFHPPD